MSDATKGYVLRPGKKHYSDGKLVKDGETVQLTEAGFKALSDKFVDPSPAQSDDSTSQVTSSPDPKPNTDVPQNISAKTADPAKNPDPKPAVKLAMPGSVAKV